MQRFVKAESDMITAASTIADRLDITLDSAIAGNEPVENVLQAVNAVRRQLATHSRKADDQSMLEVDRFRKEHSQSYRDELLECAGGSDVSQAIKCFDAAPPPVSGARAMSFDPRIAGELAADLCSYCNDIADRRGNVLQSIDATWSHLHRELDGSESGDSSSDDEGALDGCCLQYGMCLCSEDGNRLWKIRNRWLAIMKQVFPVAQKKLRGYLAIGRVFVHLQPQLPPSHDETEAAEIIELWGLETDDRYFHISDMSFSPYEPEIECASEATTEEALGAAKGEGELALKVHAFLKQLMQHRHM